MVVLFASVEVLASVALVVVASVVVVVFTAINRKAMGLRFCHKRVSPTHTIFWTLELRVFVHFILL